MITANQIHWAAGFIDGEGCLTKYSDTPSGIIVQATQNDPELLYRLRSIFGGAVYRHNSDGSCHQWVTGGARAVSVMMTIYALMSSRRQARIRELLMIWRSAPQVRTSFLRRSIDLECLASPDFKEWCAGAADRLRAIAAARASGESRDAIARKHNICVEQVGMIIGRLLNAYRSKAAPPVIPVSGRGRYVPLSERRLRPRWKKRVA